LSFPLVRMRRLRRTLAMRNMLQRVKIHPSNLVCPIFVDENAQVPVPIKVMPELVTKLYYRAVVTFTAEYSLI